MTKSPMFQIAAVTSDVFGGNPAAVSPLESWLDDGLMQSIAAENNLAETAFFIDGGEDGADFALRWFTPTTEVDLCGHATLASAYVITQIINPSLRKVSFSSRSGRLDVTCGEDDTLVLHFPAYPPQTIATPDGLAAAIGAEPQAFLQAVKANDAPGMNVALLGSPDAVRAVEPDLDFIANMSGDGLIITAEGAGEGCDFVSRYFAPASGIPEDPVTGSAHCVLIPYWAERLGKTEMSARQISQRGGELSCTLSGDRVAIGGSAALFLQGVITL